MKDLLKSLNDLKDKREGRRPIKKLDLKSKKVDLSRIEDLEKDYEDYIKKLLSTMNDVLTPINAAKENLQRVEDCIDDSQELHDKFREVGSMMFELGIEKPKGFEEMSNAIFNIYMVYSENLTQNTNNSLQEAEDYVSDLYQQFI